ncbi:MAG: DUF4411 family protein [Magnetococcales bacterium]|nr:DUF4411 family protein [Magnetococcales bacterium]
MMYLLDSNVFIEAKNWYYSFEICPGFWEWLDSVFLKGHVASIIEVYHELIRGQDDLARWVKERKKHDIFLDVADKNTQKAYSEIAIAVQSGIYSDSAKINFFKNADPWLIAKAMSTSATVVTHEVLNLETKRKVPIPNLCKEFGVPYINTFDLLRTHGTPFVLGFATGTAYPDPRRTPKRLTRQG